MGKLTQKELLQTEAFSDVMKGLAKGIVAAGPELTAPLKRAIEPITKGIEAYVKSNPVAFVKDKLKKEYYNTFYVKSLTNFQKYNIPGEPTKGGRIGVRFDAIRMKSPQSMIANNNQTPPTQQPATSNPPLSGSTATASLSANPGPDAATNIETYYAILLKGPEGWNMEVRDQTNKVIRGQKERKTKQRYNWDDEYDAEGFSDTPEYEDIKLWLSDYLPSKKEVRQSKFGTDSTDGIISNLINKSLQPGDKLDPADVQKLKAELKRYKIFENSQIDTLYEIQLLSEKLYR